MNFQILQNKNILAIGLFGILFSISYFIFLSAFGHGTTMETMLPAPIGEKTVTLISYSPPVFTSEDNLKFFYLELRETSSWDLIPKVTYYVEVARGNQHVFKKTFQSDSGFLHLVFDSKNENYIFSDSENVEFPETDIIPNDSVKISGPAFVNDGLYKFHVEILGIEDYTKSFEDHPKYDFGISFPSITSHSIDIPNYGQQKIELISYFDQIENFQYDPVTRAISFLMPFEWSEDFLNQTPFVHEELRIPKTFGELMVSNYSAFIDDRQMPNYSLTIDGLSKFTRTVHFVITQDDLFDLSNKYQGGQKKIKFLIKPSAENLPLLATTEDGSFSVHLKTVPKKIISDTTTNFYFDILDNFRASVPTSVSYDFTILYDNKELFHQKGTSIATAGQTNVEFFIPEYVNGPITLKIHDIDKKILGNLEFTLIVNKENNNNEQILSEIAIPDWIRTNASWWSNDQIGDKDFVQGIEYLIKEKIILIPKTKATISESSTEIPSWIKNNARWWADKQIDDSTFVKGIQFLIEKGILQI